MLDKESKQQEELLGMGRALRRIAAAAAAVLCVDLIFTACSSGAESVELVQVQETESDTAQTQEAEGGAQEQPEEEDAEDGDGIYVYVCGAVNSPGVYVLPEGSRVYEAIEAAGGFTEDADLTYLNQALILEDQQQITVYTEEETESLALPSADSGEESDDGLVNLNTADQAALETLPGIGEAKAQAILAYREENGAFSSIEEIQNVSGIGEATYENLKDLITVD